MMFSSVTYHVKFPAGDVVVDNNPISSREDLKRKYTQQYAKRMNNMVFQQILAGEKGGIMSAVYHLFVVGGG